MRIEFDPDKDAANIAKHGVSLVFGAAVWADRGVLVVPTTRVEDGERRFRRSGWSATVYGRPFTFTAATRPG